MSDYASSLHAMSPPLSNLRLAFVDLETTGVAATSDRITEIGIVEVDQSGVREWSSLINPGMSIPPFIQSLTGISNEMVASAPTFEDIADEIRQRLEGCLFIAHNAGFDHGFLKNEFKRTGHTFRPAVLCTVKLSRKLYPGFARHNLDSIIERHRLTTMDRHRALGDARLIWQFWQIIHQAFPPEQLELAVTELIAQPSLPSHLDASVLAELPTTHGVYLFYGENDLPLYIGKANNIRQRVMSHFSGDYVSSKELCLSQQLRRVEWHETGGEIGALLKEAMLIKTLAPTHNQRRNEEVCAWRAVVRDGCLRLALVSTDDLFFTQDEYLFGPFTSTRKATDALRFIVDQNQLCPALLGLEKTKPGLPCFASQLKKCRGACTGKESISSHNARVLDALTPIQLTAWPYRGPVGIWEGKTLHVVNDWGYLGSVASEKAAQMLISASTARFDRDVYQILKRHVPHLKEGFVYFNQAEPQ